MTVRLPEELHAWLADVARASGTSANAVIIAYLEQCKQRGWTVSRQADVYVREPG